MDFIQFTFPETLGETLAWLVALTTALVGVAIMIIPRFFLTLTGLAATHPSGFSEVRSVVGGMFTGLGLACLLLSPQPLLYFALGLAFAAVVLGRIVSFLADRAFGRFTMSATFVEVLAAFFPLAYASGVIA